MLIRFVSNNQVKHARNQEFEFLTENAELSKPVYDVRRREAPSVFVAPVRSLSCGVGCASLVALSRKLPRRAIKYYSSASVASSSDSGNIAFGIMTLSRILEGDVMPSKCRA